MPMQSVLAGQEHGVTNCLPSVHAPRYHQGMECDYLVIGAGVAGFTAASSLCQRDSGSSVFLVDSEAHVPYKRTKLSKEFAKGLDPDELAHTPPSWYENRNISLLTGKRVIKMDATKHQAVLDDGSALAYGKALLSCGARPKVPEGYPHVGRWMLFWNLSEAMAIREAWSTTEDAVIVGNGVLGVELAEQAIKLGLHTQLWSRHTEPLRRELTPRASQLLYATLRRGGVIQTVPQERHIPLALATVGAEPETTLAHNSGITCAKGILVDNFLQTSATDIWAAGDCAELSNGSISHLWHQAEALGEAAAAFMTGRTHPLTQTTFRLKTEVFGDYYWSMNRPTLPFSDVVENEKGGQYQAFFFKDELLLGAVMVNDKDRNKVYEQAVREGWKKGRVFDELGLGV